MGYISEDQHFVGNHALTGTENAPSLTALVPKDNATACRYHQAGYCRRGSTCPFAHSSTSQAPQGHSMYQREQIYSYAPLSEHTPMYHPPNPQLHSVFLWQPYPPPFPPSFDPRYLIGQPLEIDYPDDISDPSSSESSLSLSREARMALDTVHLRGRDSTNVRGMVENSVARGRAASLGQYFARSSTVVYPPPFFMPCQDGPAKKPLAYKTKLCRFYAASGKCTSGDKCTFIHDAGSDRTISEVSLPETDHQAAATLPPKPVNKYDDYKARDFYPITWRVIGGGVMMGGERQICPAFVAGNCKYGDDCKLAHETDIEADTDGFVELKPGIVRKGPKSHCPGSPKGPTPQKTPKRSRSHKRKSDRASSQVPELADSPKKDHDPKKPNANTLGEVPDTPKRPDEKEVAPPRPLPKKSQLHRRTRSLPMLTPPLARHMTPCNYAAEF
ncbi:hypothetical protein PAXRUDRAFT_14285 [Paxillus rubicundulus Ve08.2h10]|uniref:C3H1-type domain-containing protein n=1 Tax=Paxillus rubicundulus Ve08.2h10 TaxID=930991 RepID=A0A0D0DRR7_9AGAM|nr:hypothetical protein PAXRUDRAFT_14285 [Paxillus rubicundulus Ve08.2h10]